MTAQAPVLQIPISTEARDTSLSCKLISQGAEARVLRTASFIHGRRTLIKRRFVKAYRHPVLDNSLSLQRLKNEVRMIQFCRQIGVRTPFIHHIDLSKREIFMEEIEPALKVKDYINWLLALRKSSVCADGDSTHSKIDVSLNVLADHIGRTIGTLHANDVVHGDLTTSNILLRADSAESLHYSNVPRLDLIMIDFGLAYKVQLAEDKAVDLYVLERAMLSTHPDTETVFSAILQAYRLTNRKAAPDVLARYEAVKLRGRKRLMIG